MLTMLNASPRASRELIAAGASAGGGSDQENYAQDAQAFGLHAQQPQQSLPVQVSMAKSGDAAMSVRPEPRAIAVRGLASAGGAASSSARSGAPSKQTASAARREKRSTKSKCSPGLRSGKWTPEEEAFTNTIIHYFKRGLLDIEDGTSLRWYLAKRLNCEAMRVTKKLKGNSSIGKQIFRALEISSENRMAIMHARDELAMLEKQFLESLTALGQVNDPRPVRSAASSGIRLIGPDGESLQDDANLLLHFFVGAHDAVDPVLTDGKPREDEQDSSPSNMNLSVQLKLDKKRPFASVSQSAATSTASAASSTSASENPDEAAPSPSKRRSVKIEDLMD